MVGHLFQNYNTIYVRFFCLVYLRFIPKYITIFSQTRIYMRTKNPYICVTNNHVVHAVAESRRVRGTELYRLQRRKNHLAYTGEYPRGSLVVRNWHLSII